MTGTVRPTVDAPPLQIGIVAPPWLPVPPPAYGGTENVLDGLARSLQDAGHEVLLYTTGDATCPVPRAWTFPEALGVGTAGASAESRHVVEAYARMGDMDVVHDHTLVGPLYATGLSGPPVVTTNHGPFDGDLTPVYRALADRVPVLAISHHQAASAPGIALLGVIHHGLDLDLIQVGAGAGDYALFLGRMHPSKGVDTAIAVARAAGVPLRIAAKMREPVELDFFSSRVEPLLGPDVEYVGEVSGADKFALLRDAVCLLNPIRWSEPFGMVMIEALAAGTPVVTTTCGAAPEIVEEGVTGFLADDLAGLARGVRAAPRLDRAACRRAAEVGFSSQRMAAEHVAMYRRVMASTEARSARVLAGTAGRLLGAGAQSAA
jgi:glycosyltransferase involved in cell wall biosynthesis